MRTPRSAIALVVAGVLAGCLHRAPLARFGAPTPVELALLVDRKSDTQFDVPPELTAEIGSELARRNLTAEPLAPERLEPLARTRSTRTRLEMLAKLLGPDRMFVLVELKVDFFGQFEGGYKWNVNAELTLAQTDHLEEATSVAIGVPAFLDRESEGERQALQQSSSGIGERVGTLIDDRFAGRLPATAASPQPAQP